MGVLRLILAISVLIGHIPLYLPNSGTQLTYANTGVFVTGGHAVFAFFILSGFYISLIFNEKYAALPSGRERFYINRLLRIYPSYYVALIATLAVVGVGHTVFGGNHFDPMPRWAAAVFANLFIFGQELLPAPDPQNAQLELVPQAWSLSVELCFYILAPFIVTRSTRSLTAAFFVFAGFRLAMAHLWDVPLMPWRYYLLPSDIVFFLIGSVSYRAYALFRSSQYFPWLGVPAAAILLAYMLFLPLWKAADIDGPRSWGFFLAVAGATPFLFHLTRNSRLDRAIGNLSYPFYAIHSVALYLLNGSAAWALGLRDAGLAALLLSLAAAAGLRVAVERPIEALRHRVAAARRSKADLPERRIAAPIADIPVLTGIRFIAALTVVLAHGVILLRMMGPEIPLLYWIRTTAGFAMTLFFVLSGFVIHYNYCRIVTEGGLRGIAAFMWARFARIYPLFLFALLLDVMLGARVITYAGGGAADPLQDTLSALPYYLFLMHSWFYIPFGDSSLIYAPTAALSVTWSISTEWFFYLTYPLTGLLVIRLLRPGWTVAAILLLCAGWIALTSGLFERIPEINIWALRHYGAGADYNDAIRGPQDSFVRWLIYFSPYVRIGEFFLGSLIAHLYRQLSHLTVGRREASTGAVVTAAAAASIPLVLYLTYSHDHGWVFFARMATNFSIAPSCAVLILCCARYRTAFSRAVASRIPIALGEASYSSYLLHMTILLIVETIFGGALPPGPLTYAFLTAKLLLVVVLIFLLALGLHASLEVPARKWLRSLWGSRQSRSRPVLLLCVAASPLAIVLIVLAALDGMTVALPPVASGIRLVWATYGPNCSAKPGNATRSVSEICNGKEDCDYEVDVRRLGDPRSGCAKAFAAEYECLPAADHRTAGLPGESGMGSHLRLACGAKTASQSAETRSSGLDILPGAYASPQPPAVADRTDKTATPSGIDINFATYGRNCGAPPGNATDDLRTACNGKDSCDYTVDAAKLGDPKGGCAKDFTVQYGCMPGTVDFVRRLPGEAGLGSLLHLSCVGPMRGAASARPMAVIVPPGTGIYVQRATYGANCGAEEGNATVDLSNSCNGKDRCDYMIDVANFGDPKSGCGKNFSVRYRCQPAGPIFSQGLPGESGLGKHLLLDCGTQAPPDR
ncbi:MAG TPA: acyltransferase family protein [Alphaproteobacteria bacterium]|jgi:peptidoglycan/LPS O-acetylase OafA/YrhL|nr:acyltransferase family protein [Alphaproteobacteria bacterium]